ncbi:hypothetical protein [Epilithonimonas sp. UC225_85]|uniref:hypothetical protein n=1 Tax=Epilithonimonas sp. UC225_85 TaxID=3350167 RepID=UPI0036D2AFED
MNTLEITKEAALKAHDEANDKGKALLENLLGKKVFVKDIKDRIKSFDDVLDHLEIDKDEFKNECEGLSSDEIAYKQVKLIVNALNEGWVPDWTNSSQYKYFPWFKMGSSSGSGFSYSDCADWIAVSAVGSRLCFKNRELAEYAGKQFTDIYKQYMTI